MSTPVPRIYQIPAQTPVVARARVVLVDDEQGILDIWGIILTTEGYEVQCFTDPVLALEAITAGCDIVITDYRMPKMTGAELIRTARPWSKAKFILMTAHTADEVMDEAMAAGASCVVHKPTSAPLVLHKLASLCGQK